MKTSDQDIFKAFSSEPAMIDDFKRALTAHRKSRRDFLRLTSLGATGLASALLGFSGCATRKTAPHDFGEKIPVQTGDTPVSLVSGDDRRGMIIDALKPFGDEIKFAVREKQVIIKLNCVGQNGHPLMVTHPDAVRGVLDFLKPIYSNRVIIAESTVQNKNPEKTFEIFGYLDLEREYNAKIVELNDQPAEYRWILDKDLHPVRIRIIRTFLDPDNYFFSVTRLKTHNCVVATLSLKNMVMGSPLKIPKKNINEKQKMHANGTTNKSPKMINFNIFLMAHRVRPDFAVLDGFEGVEGNGPANGDPVDHRVALAGPDFLAVDRIGTELMGIPWENIGYLNYCAAAGLGQSDRSKIDIIGENITKHIRKYRLHENIDWQLTWKGDLVVDVPVER